jgi:quinol monooxygenase YgiN
MSKIALMIEIEVEEGKMDAYVKALKVHADNSMRDEPGTLNFDVMRGAKPGEVANMPEEWLSSAKNTVWLYELYEDQTAVDVHMAAASLEDFRKNTEGMAINMRIATCVTY